MARISWGKINERFYEIGIDRGLLAVDGKPVVPWNGLVSVEEKPTGGEAKTFYQDGIVFLNVSSIEEYKASIQAYYSPPEFDECDGTKKVSRGFYAAQQSRKTFDFCYRTFIGDTVSGSQQGYKLHFIYNALAEPSSRSSKTINDNPEPNVLSWDIVATPEVINGLFPTAYYFVDSTEYNPALLSYLEDILYGTETTEPRIPSPTEIMDLTLPGVPVFGKARYGVDVYA